MRFDWRSKLKSLGILEPQPQSPELLAQAIAQRLRLGQTRYALELLARAHAQYPDRLDFLEQYWDQAVRCQQADRARDACLLLIERLVEQGDLERAFFHWQAASTHLEGAILAQTQSIELMRSLLAADMGRNARVILRHTLAHINPKMPTKTMYALLNCASQVDAGLCLGLIDRLLSSASLKPKDTAALKAMQATLLETNPRISLQEPEVPEQIEVAPPVLQPDIEDPFAPSRIKVLRVRTCLFESLDREIRVRMGQRSQSMPYTAVRAVACGRIVEFGSPLYFVMDLFGDDPYDDAPFHRVLRIRAPVDHFQGFTRLADEDPQEVVLAIALQLVERSGARLIPEDFGASAGPELPQANSATEFELEIYGVSSR